ncbi:LysR substrate-binding domain-containing protein [Gryllotalpicola reticulitermitis]|uniref:LysR substrate-binding domain-containing protein n=1 Tax=Gryllotalpicola reticulitermitis TaxID=1184153 RepID=A0ABV8QA56_9MICO
MPVKFDLHRLRLLRELSLRGTIAAVAEALNYSSASVSQQLKLLQREVGATLLEPDGRGLRLTPQAHILVTHAEAILNRLEQAEADLARSREEISGTVRVAAFQTAVLALFPPALTYLKEHHPLLRVEIVQAESELARSGLLPRDFDLVVDEVYPGYPLARSALLHQQLLFTDPMRLSESAHAPSHETLRAYADAPWVLEPEGSPAREWAVAACRAAGFEPDIQFESTDVVVHERLAGAGHVVAFLPDLLPPHPESNVHRRLLSPEHHRRVVVTTRAVAQTNPAIAAVQAALREAAVPV